MDQMDETHMTSLTPTPDSRVRDQCGRALILIGNQNTGKFCSKDLSVRRQCFNHTTPALALSALQFPSGPSMVREGAASSVFWSVHLHELSPRASCHDFFYCYAARLFVLVS